MLGVRYYYICYCVYKVDRSVMVTFITKQIQYFHTVKPVKTLQYNVFTDSSKAVLLLWIIYVTSVLLLLCFRARLFIDALWSPAGKGLTSLLSFVMSNCEVVTFSLVSWVRCGS